MPLPEIAPVERSRSSVLRWSLAVVVVCAAAPAWAVEWRKADVAHVNSDQAKLVEIVSQMKSADGKELAIELRPGKEQFSVDLDFTGQDFQRVKITVRGVNRWQIARYLTDPQREKASIDLLHHPGVKLIVAEKDAVIDFSTPRAAHILAPTGRLLLKQLYHE
jgi:hypothetical protein